VLLPEVGRSGNKGDGSRRQSSFLALLRRRNENACVFPTWRGDLGRWAWEDHGRPESRRIVTAPGAAMMNEKLFVVTEDGNLWERHWRGNLFPGFEVCCQSVGDLGSQQSLI
jgi:hypothetical protein